MARNLTKSNAHFQRAVKRLPLGVASNFRFWGEERTIYVKNGVGARIIDLDHRAIVDGLLVAERLLEARDGVVVARLLQRLERVVIGGARHRGVVAAEQDENERQHDQN